MATTISEDLIEQLSQSKEDIIEDILDKECALYKDKKGKEMTQAKTEWPYQSASVMADNKINTLLQQKKIVDNMSIDTCDFPTLIAMCTNRGITISLGDITKINIDVPITITDKYPTVTLYNYSDPNNPNITPITYTDGTNNYILDNPNDKLNNNEDKYQITFDRSDVYHLVFRATERGTTTLIAGQVRMIGSYNGVNASGSTNVPYKETLPSGITISTDENGVWKYGSDSEGIESIRNKVKTYKLSSEKIGTKEYLESALLAIGCNVVKVIDNNDVIEHEGITAKHLAISCLGGNVDDIFATIHNSTTNGSINYFVIPGVSYTRLIVDERGYDNIAFHRPTQELVGITITLSDTEDIPTTIKQNIIDSLYELLIKDKYYKQQNIITIQSIQKYLNDVLYDMELNYVVDSVIFTSHPDVVKLEGDIYTSYVFNKAGIVINNNIINN